jgi:hypothetical protein
VDDVKVGTSPWSSELRRGEHRLRAELDGYLPRTVRLELEGEERTVQIELKKMHWYHHWYVWTVAAVLGAGGATTAVVLATQPH